MKINFRKLFQQYNINIELLNKKIMFRDFNISNIEKNQEINDYMYLIYSSQGSYQIFNNRFQYSITHTFDEECTPPIYCSLDFNNKYFPKKYILIPVGDFYFYQSEYIKDTIRLCEKKYLLNFLKEYNKKELFEEMSIFFKNHNFNNFDPNILLKYKYLLYRDLVNFFLNTYHRNKLVDANAEILLYCEKYILFDYEKYFNAYYKKKLNYTNLYKKLRVNSWEYRELVNLIMNNKNSYL